MARASKLRRVIQKGCGVIAALACIGSVAAAVDSKSLAYRPIAAAASKPLPAQWPTSREELEGFFDGLMATQINVTAPGATVAVVQDGELLFAKGYGHADAERKTPVDPRQTLFRVGSVSKVFTWTAVMQQVEQGKLDLDADINGYLKDFKIPATQRGPITLRNLMTHSGGFEDGTLGYLIVNSAGKLQPIEEWLPQHMPARVRPATTDFSSGAGVAYSNWATVLAGYIAATADGMPFDEYAERYIFNPLGMTRTTFREPLPAELDRDVAAGHVFESGRFERKGFEFLHNEAPAGSLSSTAVDMAKFMSAYLQGGALGDGRLLRPETVSLMHTRALSPDPALDGMALGFQESWVNGRRIIGHGGDTLFFHSMLTLLPEAGVGLFVSFNAAESGGVPGQIERAFMNHYFPGSVPQVARRAGADGHNEQYAGHYRVLRRSHTKIDKLVAATVGFDVEPDADGSLFFAHPLFGYPDAVPARWIEVDKGVFRHADEATFVAFKPAADGKMYLVGPDVTHPFERVAWYDELQFHGWLLTIAAVLFVSILVSALRHWRVDRGSPRRLRWARRTLALAGLFLLVFLLAFTVAISAGSEELLLGFPSTKLKVALALPLLAIVPSVAALAFTGFAWQMRAWTLPARLHYTAATLGTLAFLGVLNYWNLIGYRFG